LLVAFIRNATSESTKVSFVTDRLPDRLILHLVNLTSAGTWRQPVDEFIPIGPVKVRVKLPEDLHGKSMQLLVSDQKISGNVEKGWINFTIGSILDHEVVVVS